MVREAESHADEDKRKAEEIEARNRADSLIYQTEKLLSENREKLAAGDVSAVESAIADCKKAVESGDPGKIGSAIEALTHASHKIAESMYKQPGAQAAGAGSDGSAGGGGAEDDVIDAEYVDVDEGKKE
jgi:molecular chaperone DnaK